MWRQFGGLDVKAVPQRYCAVPSRATRIASVSGFCNAGALVERVELELLWVFS